MFDGLQDEAIYTFIEEQPPRDLVALTTRYQALEKRRSPTGEAGWLNWTLRLADSELFIGYVQATIRQDCVAEVAYVVFPRWWGHGYATEAVSAMIGHLEQHDVREFVARVHRDNSRSIALLRRLGFLRTDRYHPSHGASEADYLFRLTK